MKTYEATGKNYEEALQNGLTALHATISDVTVETLEEGSKGLFGLFGSKPCKLRLTLHEVEEEVEEDDPLADLLSSVKVEAPKPAAQPKPQPCSDDFRALILKAASLAEPGDAVLLSPACASWGMFDNFEQRGDIFKEIVNSL